MKRKVPIYRGGQAYLGKRAYQDGYKGDVEALENAFTITLLKPGVSLATIKKSLEVVIQDIELRIQGKKDDNK